MAEPRPPRRRKAAPDELGALPLLPPFLGSLVVAIVSGLVVHAVTKRLRW